MKCVQLLRVASLAVVIISQAGFSVVQEIKRINQRELDLGISGSWHDDYKGAWPDSDGLVSPANDRSDSAYIFAGGLHRDLTEGDVIAIFSQYGEVMNINMPRDKETGKPKGFAFLMYEDQRSTVLAVDNLNGANILERTVRVDHVKNYKEKRVKNDDGEWVDPEEQSLNAKPEMVIGALPPSHLPVIFSTDLRNLQMVLRGSLRNLISAQILTLRIPCVTSSLRSVGRRGPARKRSPRSPRMKHPRKDEHGRNARGKRRRRRSYREGRTPCAVWRSCSNPWESRGKTTKVGHYEGAEAGVLRRLGEAATGQDAAGPPNRIPLVRAGEAQVDPDPPGGGKKNPMVFAR
jgi:hypothetical protein